MPQISTPSDQRDSVWQRHLDQVRANDADDLHSQNPPALSARNQMYPSQAQAAKNMSAILAAIR